MPPSLAVARRLLLALGVFGALTVAAPRALAQTPAEAEGPRATQLILNGYEVAGATTELVPGTTYAPAAALAAALGASWRFDAEGGLFSLEFGGRFLSLRAFGAPEAAAAAQGALWVDGREAPGPGAVVVAGEPYLPVKGVVAALGGHTAQVAGGATQVVTVVFPRPQLTAVRSPGVWGRAERFVLEFSAPVAVEPLYEPSLRVLRLRFPRALLGDGVATGRFSGTHFSDAALVPDVGYLDFNLTLRAGQDYSLFSEPAGAGQRVVLDLFARGDRGGEVNAEAPTLILDPSGQTAALAGELQRLLGARGVNAELTWTQDPAPPEVRARSGVGAPLFVTLSRAPLGPGRVNLYYLAPETPSALLQAPLRAGAEAPLSEAGRERLAALPLDLALGERVARLLGTALKARTGLQPRLVEAPLFALSGAAGRGVMLELSTAVPTTPGLVAALAESLAAVLAAETGLSLIHI